MDLNLPAELVQALHAIIQVGGKPLIVGGAVRDAVMGLPTRDYDVEVHGLLPNALEGALKRVGRVDAVGQQFGVFKLAGVAADFSIPRRDSKTGVGHRGFRADCDPFMGVKEAARRRDLTINSLAYDPVTGEVYDHFGGLSDIKERILRATDATKFGEDPLRAMRAAQFKARLGFSVDLQLAALMAATDLSELPGERLYGEWTKLLGGRFAGDALRLLLSTNLLKQFPELWSMVGTPQDRIWHPEGDVFEHTCLALDRASELSDNKVVLWAVLLHDAGKPTTTKLEEGRIRARGHEEAGVAPSRSFFNALRAPDDLKRAVCALVENHLAPAHFVPDDAHARKRTAAGASAYRRLARKLGVAGTDLETLYLVSKADHFGRTTEDALARRFPSGETFLERATAVQVRVRPEPDVVQGRDLIARGFEPGPQFGEILAKCREVQYDRGLKDADVILKEALAPN